MELEPNELKTDICDSIMEIGRFIYTDEFQSLLSEFKDTPKGLRSDFINKIVFNKKELKKRKVFVPPGMAIQKSTFGDGRPTLFCVTKYLKDKKRKVTITFDEGWEKAV
jgi:hypothetical protein